MRNQRACLLHMTEELHRQLCSLVRLAVGGGGGGRGGREEEEGERETRVISHSRRF